MTKSSDPFRFPLFAVCGGMNQQQLQLIDRLLSGREPIAARTIGRLPFEDDPRRRLAARAKGLGSKLLREVATIVTPETLLAWQSPADRAEIRWQWQTGMRPSEKIAGDGESGGAHGDAVDRTLDL